MLRPRNYKEIPDALKEEQKMVSNLLWDKNCPIEKAIEMAEAFNQKLAAAGIPKGQWFVTDKAIIERNRKNWGIK